MALPYGSLYVYGGLQIGENIPGTPDGTDDTDMFWVDFFSKIGDVDHNGTIITQTIGRPDIFV